MKFPYIAFFTFIITLFISAQPAFPLPQFAVLTHNKCINCHINSQGGGLRNFSGWKFLNDVGLLKPEQLKLNKLYKYDGESNTVFNRKLTLGTDFRLQMARSHKYKATKRRVFPMQAAVYADYRIVSWLHTYSSYNFGPKKFNGQKSWVASAIIQPEFSYTQFQIGYFQPSIGIRYDDHTMLVRQVPGANGNTLIPPNYAEYGAEFTFNGLDWLILNAGIFDAESLAENFIINKSGKQVSLISDKHNPSWLGRFVFNPRISGSKKGLYAGSSYFINDDFSITNFFTGIGMIENLSIIADYAITSKTGIRKTNNLMLEFTYSLLEPLIITVRGEKGATVFEIGGNDIETYLNQLVMGVQIFILPYIEVRPEYRILDTEQYKTSRYALQLHIFH